MSSDRFQSRYATNRELTKFLARVNAEVEVKNLGLIRQQLGVNSCYAPTLKYDPHLSLFLLGVESITRLAEKNILPTFSSTNYM